jgi:hypothetical protein
MDGRYLMTRQKGYPLERVNAGYQGPVMIESWSLNILPAWFSG